MGGGNTVATPSALRSVSSSSPTSPWLCETVLEPAQGRCQPLELLLPAVVVLGAARSVMR
eukprot:6492795-Amphidinium_carterae.2